MRAIENLKMQKMERQKSGQMKDTTYDQDQKNTVQCALAQSDEQSIVLPKTHTHVMMTQLNIKDRLRAFGNKGDEAILKEIKQLHTRQALMPRSRNNMSYEERKKALRYLMFLKEKRDGEPDTLTYGTSSWQTR